ncbi:MAG TPA: hypothetical protein RMH99_12260 [Sandaracinaceae bacterium LLY-WYZ-13_1]|nr:hypothetical protein [Sandaracinaceae bacterium LLY-WYZ-13_1]
MRRFSMWAAVTASMFTFACGGAATTPSAGRASMPVAERAPEAGAEVATDEAPAAEVSFASLDLSGLPSAPWSSAPLASEQVPGPVLQAWAAARNRGVCAPLAPADVEGASARVSDLVEGGWAVEFDRRGMPGLSASGETCRRCGRGVFGIAGTGMSPDALVTEEDEADVPSPSFADGSHLQVEPPAEGESVAAATLTVRGQGCVYQVWSFLGEEHVRALVEQLRRVEVRGETPTVAAR